jgi:hypothetical protein
VTDAGLEEPGVLNNLDCLDPSLTKVTDMGSKQHRADQGEKT